MSRVDHHEFTSRMAANADWREERVDRKGESGILLNILLPTARITKGLFERLKKLKPLNTVKLKNLVFNL